MPSSTGSESLLLADSSSWKAPRHEDVFGQPPPWTATNGTARQVSLTIHSSELLMLGPSNEADGAEWAEVGAPSHALILQQLHRVLRSKPFVQSEKLSRFLRLVVEHVLEGKQSCLKEYLVGVEVYDRKPPYDPSQDSIVRTEARRLRNKLKEYYGEEGKDDPVYIYLRPGSYIPSFQCRKELVGMQVAVGPSAPVVPSRFPAVIAVLCFSDISQNPISARFARCVPDELAYALMSEGGCTVIYPASIDQPGADGNIVTTMNDAGATIIFEGSVRAEDSSLRITARIIDAVGVQLWLKRIDVEIGMQAAFAVEEQIARELALGLRSLQTSVSGGSLPSHG